MSVKLIALLLGTVITPMWSRAAPAVDFNQAPLLALPTGSANEVVAGDFNRDGKPDLALSTGYVLLNRGDGTFTPPTNFVYRSRVSSELTASDFDGDGNLDIAGIYDTTITVLLGDGAGEFGPPATYPCDKYSGLVSVGDFNGDGHPDLVTAGEYASGGRAVQRLLILFNDGAARFNQRTTIELGDAPTSVTVADFNGDGNLDLITRHYGGEIVKLIAGNGDGTFQSAVPLDTGVRVSKVAVGDFNEDSHLDLAIFDTLEVSVWLGDGGSTFTLSGRTALLSGVTRSQFQTEDFNGDGHLDLLFASTYTSIINLLFGDGEGHFEVAYYAAGTRVDSLDVADFDGDGDTDIVVVPGLSSFTLSVLFNEGDGNFAAPQAYPPALCTSSVALADVNGDAHLDVIAAGCDGPTIYLRLGRGDGSFGGVQRYPVENAQSSLDLGDLNGDGNLDMTFSIYTNRIGVLLASGDGRFTNGASVVLRSRPFWVRLGDFNGDGKLDAFAAFSTSSSVLLGNGDGTFGPEMNMQIPGHGAALLADVNDDNKLDLVMGLNVYLGGGDGSLAPFGTNNLTFQYDVKAADFNGDGKLDLVAASSRGPAAVYTGDGNGNFTEVSRYSAGSALGIGVADFNQDGKLDFVISGEYSRVYLGHGDGTFAPSADFFAAGEVAVGDLNHDGQPDLMTSRGTVLLNQTSTKLELTRATGGISLGWPAYTAGLVLERTESLLASNWQGVPTSSVSVVGDRYVVTEPLAETNRFYRLRRQ